MVMKRNTRNKIIGKFGDEGLFPDLKFPSVDSCLVSEMIILLGLIIKFLVLLLAMAELLGLFEEALFLMFRSLEQSSERCFWFLYIIRPHFMSTWQYACLN